MSFLSTNNSEYLSARITQKGRNAIARGSFNIKYFQIGDSEFDYNLLFSGLTGNSNHQMVMSPFDKESGVKYPYKIDSSVSGTTYGIPVNNYTAPEPIRNVMGPAGFVSNYLDYNAEDCTGTTIRCYTESISFSLINGTNSLQVISGNNFQTSENITIVLSEFCGTDPDYPVISGNSVSFIYKVISINGNTLTLDRNLPNISSVVGYGQIVSNKCELEYPNTNSTTCPPIPIDNIEQHNPWTLDVVWGDIKPIGANILGNDNSLSSYTGNRFISAKEYLGYTSNDQTYTDVTGGTITHPTSFLNSYSEIVNVPSNEQRVIAVIHYSELGDLINDPERFFKYDDYISTLSTNPITVDETNSPITDENYFEIYIPFIQYHNSSSSVFGATFVMDNDDYYINSTINNRHQLLFRYLLDENGIRVGKVFPKNKIVVFDDQEIVAILDIRTNRRHTLGAPRVGLVGTNMNPTSSLFDGTTGSTLWITYMLSDSPTVSSFNSLPCNYYSKIESTTVPSSATVRFKGTAFQFMSDNISDITTKFLAKKFYILAQFTNTGDLPLSNSWVLMDFTAEAGGSGTSYIIPSFLIGNTFTITKNKYTNGTYFFNLDTFMGSGYTSVSGHTQFGEEQPFPGSIRLVRSTDIESLNFLVNLPSTQFTETQNPTYVSGDKRITEITLLDSNKEVLVVAKTPLPIKRTGTQVFSLKLDF